MNEGVQQSWDNYELEEFESLYSKAEWGDLDYFIDEFFIFYKKIVKVEYCDEEKWNLEMENKYLKIIIEKTEKVKLIRRMKYFGIDYRKVYNEMELLDYPL